jgi:hypothetical protein
MQLNAATLREDERNGTLDEDVLNELGGLLHALEVSTQAHE